MDEASRDVLDGRLVTSVRAVVVLAERIVVQDGVRMIPGARAGARPR